MYADFRFCSPQLDTNEITDTGQVHRVVCVFTAKLSPVLILPTHDVLMPVWIEGCQVELTYVGG